ncbi:hypothetical protein [Lysinibacillus parviboronicapiens]|nr:hypothetical protein [Lysinibacillus parviboronicapiens]
MQGKLFQPIDVLKATNKQQPPSMQENSEPLIRVGEDEWFEFLSSPFIIYSTFRTALSRFICVMVRMSV